MDAVLLQQDQANRVKDAIETEVFKLTGKPYDKSRPENTGIWWLETLELMEHLEVKKVSVGDSAFFVGFGDGMHSTVDGGTPLSYEAIAKKNEENHPLIKPTWEKLEDDFLNEWKDLVLKATRGGA